MWPAVLLLLLGAAIGIESGLRGGDWGIAPAVGLLVVAVVWLAWNLSRRAAQEAERLREQERLVITAERLTIIRLVQEGALYKNPRWAEAILSDAIAYATDRAAERNELDAIDFDDEGGLIEPDPKALPEAVPDPRDVNRYLLKFAKSNSGLAP